MENNIEKLISDISSCASAFISEGKAYVSFDHDKLRNALQAAPVREVVDASKEYSRGWVAGANETMEVCKSNIMAMMNQLGTFQPKWNSPIAVCNKLQSLIDRGERAALTPNKTTPTKETEKE